MEKNVLITPPNFQTAIFKIKGVSPLVTNKFSEKSKNQMMEDQKKGSQNKKGKKKEAKDFDLEYKNAFHFSREGWPGLHAGAVRNSLISACRLCGFQMTLAKLSVFVEPDGFDKDEGTPLIKIIGKYRPLKLIVRLPMGKPDVRIRPIWDDWSIDLKIRFDADIFSLEDVSNLLMRAGMQVGWGEGRPDSKKSCGQGWGLFKIEEKK